jgi:hypothetical protein
MTSLFSSSPSPHSVAIQGPESISKTSPPPRHFSNHRVSKEMDHRSSHSLQFSPCDLAVSHRSLSHNVNPMRDNQVLALLEDDEALAGTARKNWKQKDAELKKETKLATIRREEHYVSPQTPQSTRKYARAPHASPCSTLGISPLKKSGLDRWGESPQNTLRKTAVLPPTSWHGRATTSPESNPTSTPRFPPSPFRASPPDTTGSCLGISHFSPEWNQSMSSLAPQLPKRFASDDSVASVGTTNVVRGHRLFKIESTFKHCTVDSFLPSIASGDEIGGTGGLHARQITEQVSSASRRLMVLESNHKESYSLDRLVEEDADAVSSLSNDVTTRKKSDRSLAVGSWEEIHETNESHMTKSPFYQKKYASREVELEEYEVINDKMTNLASDEVVQVEEKKNPHLELVDVAPGKDLVVDKVPKKRWSSKNIENFPVWPPVVKVIKFENRNISGESVRSDFSDDLTASEGDFLSSLGDYDLSVEAEMALLLPEQQTSYRIRYDGPTNLTSRHETFGLPPIQFHDDRFEPLHGSTDHAPNPPTRTRKYDTVPIAPRRGSSVDIVDDDSFSAEQVVSTSCRPDVWITPIDSDETKNAIWKVKRVWKVEEEDGKEEVHSVRTNHLFNKIKTLVGAPDSPSYASSPARYGEETAEDKMIRSPRCSWHVLSIVERNGKMDNLGPERKFADDEFKEKLHHMAVEAEKEIDLNKKSIEEAKKRIMMLRGSGTTRTLRQAPMKLRRNVTDALAQPVDSSNENHTQVGDPAARNARESELNGRSDKSPYSAEIVESTPSKTSKTSSARALASATVRESCSTNGAAAETTGTLNLCLSPKKKKRQKSSSENKSPGCLSPNKIRQHSTPSKCSYDGSLDIPPVQSRFPSTATPSGAKKRMKKKTPKDGEIASSKENVRSPIEKCEDAVLSPVRRIFARDMVALSDSDTDPEEEQAHKAVSIEQATSLNACSPKASSFPEKERPLSSTPIRKKIQASAMVHDSDSEDDSTSQPSNQKVKVKSGIDSFKESRKNGLSWWQVSDSDFLPANPFPCCKESLRESVENRKTP